jgi:hypothetical protein
MYRYSLKRHYLATSVKECFKICYELNQVITQFPRTIPRKKIVLEFSFKYLFADCYATFTNEVNTANYFSKNWHKKMITHFCTYLLISFDIITVLVC